MAHQHVCCSLRRFCRTALQIMPGYTCGHQLLCVRPEENPCSVSMLYTALVPALAMRLPGILTCGGRTGNL